MKWWLSALVIFGALLLILSIREKEPPEIVPIKPVVPVVVTGPKYQVIGTSVQGRKIESYTYGTGPTKVVFVGGIHGGYEWNSVLLAYQLSDYLKANPKIVPNNLSITVIPTINPDGVFAVTGKEGRFALADVSTDKQVLASGRFNADKVDLNRNFDCHWQATSTWQTKTVSAGTAPFSEPEAIAFRNFALKEKPVAVIFWHSQSNAIYASACENGILAGTLAMMDAYARASGYPAVKTFDSYAVTGAADDWLASINIPAMSVELQTHETVEWERNLAGFKSLLEYFTKRDITKADAL